MSGFAQFLLEGARSGSTGRKGVLELSEHKGSIPKNLFMGKTKSIPHSSNSQLPGWGCGASQTPPSSGQHLVPPPCAQKGPPPPELRISPKPNKLQPQRRRKSAPKSVKNPQVCGQGSEMGEMQHNPEPCPSPPPPCSLEDLCKAPQRPGLGFFYPWLLLR